MKRLIAFLLISIFFLNLTTLVAARSGCCSWHDGVRADGCGCNDGTPLSDKCAPYYTCTANQPVEQTAPIIIYPTNTPIPLPTWTPIPTITPSPSILPTNTLAPTTISNSSSVYPTIEPTIAVQSSIESNINPLGVFILVCGGYWWIRRTKKNL